QAGKVVTSRGPIQKIIKQREALKLTAEGTMFSDFTIEDSAGQSVAFSEYIGKGKYVLVDFWASWCGPCKAELPNIREIYDKYNGEDFTVLGVAVWEKPEDTKKGIEELGIIWPCIINAQSIPTDIYGINGIPHIILFGPDGTIVARGLRGEAMKAKVAEVLGR
ncbi:MAG TPA: TlpA disulfide reductase family protein, partial [Bacteroidales bacterium]|nr:TlpA disulfide reductase family protein [Bacteroidales bacterium]